MSEELYVKPNIININQRRLPPPEDITLRYTKISGQVIITWTPIQGADHQVYYNIYRGTAFTGIFYKQNNVPLIMNQYIDNFLSRNPNIVYWYKVSSIYKANDQWIEGQSSRPIQYKINNLNKWFQKMNERNFFILQNDGLNFQLFQRKYSGERCTCYDEIRGSAGASTCPICCGTGFKAPFSPPVELYVRLNVQEATLAQDLEGYNFVQACNAWTISSIRLQTRDILVSPEGNIYSIIAVNSHNAAGYWGHQQLRILSVDARDPIYNFLRITMKPSY